MIFKDPSRGQEIIPSCVRVLIQFLPRLLGDVTEKLNQIDQESSVLKALVIRSYRSLFGGE